MDDLLGLALWLTGVASFCVLIAGAWAPVQLNWKEELARLSSFNRKIHWVYYAFIGLTIVSFGVLTLVFHDEMLTGDPVALGLALFMGLWWTARILVDIFVFRHGDWPEGRSFVYGHALLTATFVAMAATYLAVVGWHVCRLG